MLVLVPLVLVLVLVLVLLVLLLLRLLLLLLRFIDRPLDLKLSHAELRSALGRLQLREPRPARPNATGAFHCLALALQCLSFHFHSLLLTFQCLFTVNH